MAQLGLSVDLADLKRCKGLKMAIQESFLYIRDEDLKGMGLQKAKNHSTVALVQF